jgi:glucose dehydrogenase
MKHTLIVSLLAMVAVVGSASADPVTSSDLLKAQDNGKEWLSYGRDYRNWRYSPLS